MSTAETITEVLDTDELARYGRHLVLGEVGREGQEKLKAARVLLVGAGGLGSPAALYLAAAGVGTLGLVDDDRVELSNLQRQVLYGDADLGRPKVEVARERLAAVNPHVEIEVHGGRLGLDNVYELIEPYDLVVDGSDNAATRYLVNDACKIAGKPDVWGAVLRFEGQVSIFGVPGGPCYRCLFPEPPPAGEVPSCAEGGVLGVLPGIVGSLQANEAIKQILGVGQPLVGRLVIFDALATSFREVRLAPDPACPLCSKPAEEREIREVETVCGEAPSAVVEEAEETPLPFEISVDELAAWLEEGREIELLDVRQPYEHEIAHLEGARLLPLSELPERLDELESGVVRVVYCHHGMRSAQAVMFLRQQGHERSVNLRGGIDAWSRQIDPSLRRY